ncbi:MAG TPA: Hsp20/alpha crystallin family protein [Candidatus Paceibacterota bacterium]|nr:Hsp20/alpha crystallin family protein [Candidatus Paceibacterota bacterium]
MVNIVKKNSQPQEVQSFESQPSPLSLINRFFDDPFFDPFATLTPSLMGNRRLGSISSTFPKVDVTETDSEIRVTANVPGIDPERIDIEVGDDYLSLSGKIEKQNESNDEKGRVYRYEREYGEFRREFALPVRVNKDGIVAKAKNGVLSISLPKMEDERKTKVKVEVEK